MKIKEKFFVLPLPVQASVIVTWLVLVFGLIAPSLVSSNSTPAVWIGVALLFISGYAAWELSSELRKLLK